MKVSVVSFTLRLLLFLGRGLGIYSVAGRMDSGEI
jgi:hypothetical protein